MCSTDTKRADTTRADIERAETERVSSVARRQLYHFLALACSDPRSRRWSKLQDPQLRELALAAAAHLAAHTAAQPESLAPGELSPAQLDLSPLLGFLDQPGLDHVAAHDRVYGLLSSSECTPHETSYCPQTFSVYRSSRLADIAGFYRAFGVSASRDQPERVDHIALELEFMAWLLAKEEHARASEDDTVLERAEICQDAQRRFLEEHLAWWVPAYAGALWKRTEGTPGPVGAADPPRTFHGALALALAAFVPVERALAGVAPPQELVEPLPAQDTEAPDCDGCGVGSSG